MSSLDGTWPSSQPRAGPQSAISRLGTSPSPRFWPSAQGSQPRQTHVHSVLMLCRAPVPRRQIYQESADPGQSGVEPAVVGWDIAEHGGTWWNTEEHGTAGPG